MTDIKTTNRTVLRWMLRNADRSCWAYSTLKHVGSYHASQWEKHDARRREIRRRLKERRDG